MQTTWSGGQHILFSYHPDAGNSAGCYGRWLDGKNDGGYIVVAPSSVVEGIREGEYKWILDLTTPLALPRRQVPSQLLIAVCGIPLGIAHEASAPSCSKRRSQCSRVAWCS